MSNGFIQVISHHGRATARQRGRIIVVQEEGLGADLVQGLLLARGFSTCGLGCHELLPFCINLLAVESP